jgi:chloramphenicol O-acetyltransferase
MTLPEVDSARIGVTGNSGGGTMTTFVNALDDRLFMASPSCYVTTWLHEVENELPADIEQMPPHAMEYGLDMVNHPNWFDASFISWLSYDSLHLELPDGNLYFAPIINWGKYREENGRLVMPVTVRLNHAIADGYLVANVFRLLEQEIRCLSGYNR